MHHVVPIVQIVQYDAFPHPRLCNIQPKRRPLQRSPVKRSKVKANTWVRIPGQKERRNQLEQKLTALLNCANPFADEMPAFETPKEPEDNVAAQDMMVGVEESSSATDTLVDIEDGCMEDSLEAVVPENMPVNALVRAVNMESRTQVEARKLDSHWKKLLPILVEPFVSYRDRTVGRVGDHFNGFVQLCSSALCQTKTDKSEPDHRELTPCVAFSISLLDLYHALREKSCDAVTALVGALDKGEALQDPIRRGLGQSAQWYDCLLVQVEQHLEALVQNSKQTEAISPLLQPPPIYPQTAASATSTSLPTPTTESTTTSTPEDPPLTPGRCMPLLQQLCPACFEGCDFGQPFDKYGGDIHIALDRSLHHRHLKSAGEGIPFHSSWHFLSKEFVNVVGDRIEEACKKSAKAQMPQVPDEAIDGCTELYRAVKGEDEKATSGTTTRMGSWPCPREKQKYAVALLEAMVPRETTIGALYDIGCVLHRSLSMYDLLATEHTSRLLLATSVMHAYGHQWACQLHYNPRLRLRAGLGLTDGEGPLSSGILNISKGNMSQ
ncbi:hypothetical protein L218DRAFT_1071469 [Marasmius fiardii PR-910]|nr:hypothetical protein L218DRAFT_1071469 [Marasmius fiardii PR-910]